MNYDDMPAGREMNKLVAETFFGPCFFVMEGDREEDLVWEHASGLVPRYSEEIAAAWPVAEKLEGEARDKFHDIMGDVCAMNDLWLMTATEAALTICRAALHAVDLT